jgi:AbrB family looped-hinge helix DNA binding protein
MKEREAHVSMDKKGRITIPAAFLRHLGISDGDKLMFRMEDGELSITTTSSRTERVRSRKPTRRFARQG